MFNSQKYLGEYYIGSSILLWSFFPIVLILSFSNVSPIFTAGFSSLIAGIVFLLSLAFKKQLGFFKSCTVWKDILLSTFLVGIIFYGLIFYGISKTTAINASIFSEFEVLSTFIILSLILKNEGIVKNHIIGALLMLIGAIIILFPYNGEFTVNTGDYIIIFATIFTPLGNMYAKRALQQVSSSFFMMIRSFISGIFLLGFAFLIDGGFPNLEELNLSMPFLLINGILLLGLSKIFYLEGIKRLPISKCAALYVVCPAITIILAYFILNEVPTIWQLVGFVPISVGILLLLKKA